VPNTVTTKMTQRQRVIGDSDQSSCNFFVEERLEAAKDGRCQKMVWQLLRIFWADYRTRAPPFQEGLALHDDMPLPLKECERLGNLLPRDVTPKKVPEARARLWPVLDQTPQDMIGGPLRQVHLSVCKQIMAKASLAEALP
jgi:hypothetical protein